MKKTVLFSLLICLFLSIGNSAAQTPTQTIKGVVIDKQSQATIPGVNIVIMNSDPLKGVSTDMDGHFKITEVKPGRYDLKVTYLGYKEIVIPNVVVTAGKEVSLDVALEENVNSLKEIVISGTKKNETNNEMSTISARSFSMEEVNRYAGGRSDPSRLAANFAGVSSPDDSRNDIVIRGNSPTGVLWRIEGLNVPNPNHFSTVGTTGGPVSAINTNVLKNSDFFTSAFPSEYGNANAGVFDLGFRSGNADKREHTIQFGALTGLEAMTEGPINKSKGSSYLFAYRYSFTGFAQALGIPVGTTATPFYQDLSFKINSGNTKLGKFTLFGLGGVSKIEFLHNKIDSTDLFADPTTDSYFTSDIGVVGLKHFIRLGAKSYMSTVIGSTYAASNFNLDTISISDETPSRTLENKTTRIHYSANTSFNSKINSKLFIKIGAMAEIMNLNLFYRNKESNGSWNQIWDYNDYTTLVQGYAHAKYNFTDKLTLNAGVHAQMLTLNNATSVEPRAGLKYQVNNKNAISVGYGMHSQMQPTDVYFYRELKADGTYDQSNKDLEFTKSQHFVLGYDVLPAKDWRVKLEVYYQMLSNIPVTNTPSSFSMLNAGASFNPNEQGSLKNKGTGTNYGTELTIEKFFSRGYYGLITGTLYESKYKGSDNIERNTAFNGKFVYNVLIGKEFKVGKEKRNAISFDIKMTQAGGRYYTPVDLVASQAAQQEVLSNDSLAFSARYSNFFRLDVKMGYTMNSKKRNVSQSLFFDIQNITNNKNVFAERYNPQTNKINTAYQIGFFPNFTYKVQF
ncbi:MAG: TonB-dependent receptor [Bacteroidetes bacterium]|nr:TonB-dependent receptor [Bacteroidota bacterium]